MTNSEHEIAWRDRAEGSVAAHAHPETRAFGGFLDARPLFLAVASLPTALILGLIAIVVWTSFVDNVAVSFVSGFSLEHYRALVEDPLVLASLENTAWFVLVTVGVAMCFGLSAAWLVERTDLPGKQTVYSLMTGLLLFPTIFMAMGWMFLLHPRIGILNAWLTETFGLRAPPFSIDNVVGMGWIEGLGLASLAFVITSPILRALDAALDDVATVHGVGRWPIFTRITLPLIAPALVAAAIYVAVIAIATFEVPAVVGLGSKIYTFSTFVYIKSVPETGLPDYGVIGAVSVILIPFSLLLSWWYFRVIRLSHRYEVVRGRGYRAKLLPLGRWRWAAAALIVAYFILALVLPFLMMVWVALLPYMQPFSVAAFHQMSLGNFAEMDWDLLWRSTQHTLVLMAAVPTLSLGFGIAISWVVVRSRLRGRFLYDWIAFLPHAVPNLIFAIAMVIVALDLVPNGVPFYGTVFILMLVYVLVRISLVTRVLNAALVQIHPELEEAAQVSGLSTLMTVVKVSVPLLLPAFANLWIWTALLTYRELTMAAFMVTRDNITLPVLVWEQWNSGNSATAAAISLLFMFLFLPLIAAYWALNRRTKLGGVGTEPGRAASASAAANKQAAPAI